jgi:hypothetical protein
MLTQIVITANKLIDLQKKALFGPKRFAGEMSYEAPLQTTQWRSWNPAITWVDVQNGVYN